MVPRKDVPGIAATSLGGTDVPLLKAMVSDQGWFPRETNPARCIRNDVSEHEAPHLVCSCGYYVSRRLHEVRRLLLNQRYDKRMSGWVVAVGEAQIWGTVVLHREGARGEYAYPSSLFLPSMSHGDSMEPLAECLQEVYGIPVEAIPTEYLNAWGTSEWEPLRELSARKDFAPVDWRTILGEVR